MPTDFVSKLKAGADSLGLNVPTAKAEKFDVYRQLLASANKRFNLTSVNEEDYLQEHFLDSLTLLQTHRVRPGQKVADVGSGAGFPGLPLKIMVEDLELHLIEAHAKKADFLRCVVSELGIGGTVIHQSRAEEAARSLELREKMDLVTARAVARLEVLLEYALPFCKIGGWFLALKGPKQEEEMEAAEKAASELGGRIEMVFSPEGRAAESRRVIVTVLKIESTAAKYPRRVGVPLKRPLGGGSR